MAKDRREVAAGDLADDLAGDRDGATRSSRSTAFQGDTEKSASDAGFAFGKRSIAAGEGRLVPGNHPAEAGLQ